MVEEESVSREVEDVSVVNRQRLALAELLKSVRESSPSPAPGPLLRVGERGALTSNKGVTVREGKQPTTK